MCKIFLWCKGGARCTTFSTDYTLFSDGRIRINERNLFIYQQHHTVNECSPFIPACVTSSVRMNRRHVDVENKEKLVSNDIKNNHAKIVERQKMTYAEAVKMQNRECMEEMKQHLTPASSH